MQYRIVVITTRSKLSFKNNYLIIKGENTIEEFIDNINTLIIESNEVEITSYLINYLIEKGVRILFGNVKEILGQTLSFHGNYECVKRQNEQLHWNEEIKGLVWKRIIENKIKMQQQCLSINNKNKRVLSKYVNKVTPGDKLNIEGVVAKKYFKYLFGREFNRDKECVINHALNYGYTILLSLVNQAIINFGYSTLVGINHHNYLNVYNLSCDLMEPFRPIVDNIVINSNNECLDQNLKIELKKITMTVVIYKNKKYLLLNCINKMIQDIRKSFMNNTNYIGDVQFDY